MKLRGALIILVLLLCVPLMAQNKPPLDIPIYPGGETTMEINLTNEDLLPMMKAMLPMLSGNMGKMAEKIDANELALVFKDVKRIEFVQVAVNKSGITESDIAGFYGKKVPQGQWSRVFWQSEKPLGTIALYCQGAGEGLYGFRVQTAMIEGKPVRQVMIVKTQGKIDVVKLMIVAGKVMGS